MHKFAGDVKHNDQFLMAGDLYTIIEDAAETSADDMVKITFVAVHGTARKCTMILERNKLFVTY